MTITRRRILAATAAAPLAAPWIAGTARAEAKKLKISHQFPGGTIDTGDFRDQLCRRFAADLEKKTNGALSAEIYPNSSLVKTVAQYSRDPPRRARHDALSAELRRRRGQRIQHRLHAGRRQLLRRRAMPGRRPRSASA